MLLFYNVHLYSHTQGPANQQLWQFWDFHLWIPVTNPRDKKLRQRYSESMDMNISLFWRGFLSSIRALLLSASWFWNHTKIKQLFYIGSTETTTYISRKIWSYFYLAYLFQEKGSKSRRMRLTVAYTVISYSISFSSSYALENCAM